MVTIVLLNEAWMCAMPWETCLRSFFLNVFFLPFFSGAAAPPAAAGFAIVFQSFAVGRSWLVISCERPSSTTNDSPTSLSQSSSLPPLCLCADLFGCGHWCVYVVHTP